MWTKAVLRTLASLILAASLCVLPCLPANAATQPWSALTPVQQEALAPIAHEWSTMPDIQQKRLLATTKRYPQLSPKKKQLFLARLTEWSKLTPEQRARAREKYKAFSKVPTEKREEVKRMVRQHEAEKLSAVAASAVAPAADK